MSKKPVASDLALLDPFWKETVERRVLPNGLTVLVKRDATAPVASVQVWVKTGSVHEGPWSGAGISHFVEHLLFKGTSRREGRSISREVQAHGGYINAYTTFDRTVYYVDLPGEHVGVAMDLLADMVLHSTFPEAEVAKERDVILREIDMGRDDPDQRFSEALFETAFRRHPYRYPIIGYKDVFQTITREELLAYYRERYVPNNAVLVVAGAVDPAEIFRLAEQVWGSAPRGRLAPVHVPEEPAQLAPRALHRSDKVELTRAGLSWPLPGIQHPDAPVLDMLAGLLGGGDSSLLWQELREKARLVHTIDAHSWTPGSCGLFFVSFTCEPDKRTLAEAAIGKLVARVVRTGFSAEARRKALRQMVVSEINSRKTISGQAARLGSAEVVAGDLSFAHTYFARVGRITNRDLQRVAAAYLRPEVCTAVSLSPEGAAGVSPGVYREEGERSALYQEELANGVRLLIQENNSLPNVHVRVLCRGGVYADEAGRRGAAGLMTTLLTKDTKTRSAAEVASAIEQVGGALYPFSGNNSLGVALEVLPSDLELGLELLRQAVMEPTFRATSVAVEREAQLAELKQESDDAVTYARKSLRRRFFHGHPLAEEIGGVPEELRQVKPADLARLWARVRVGGNVVVSVAGAVSAKKLAARLRPWLQRIPRGTFVEAASPFIPAPGRSEVDVQEREQAVVYCAYPCGGVRANDLYVAEVADELFSGMSSRLFERVREEKGLAYFVRSSRIVGLDTGLFAFMAGTHPTHVEAVQREYAAEVERVRAGRVEPEELTRCQVRLKAGRKMGLQTNGARAMLVGLNALYGWPQEEVEAYDERIDAVTVADLRTFARTYFREEQALRYVLRRQI